MSIFGKKRKDKSSKSSNSGKGKGKSVSSKSSADSKKGGNNSSSSLSKSSVNSASTISNSAATKEQIGKINAKLSEIQREIKDAETCMFSLCNRTERLKQLQSSLKNKAKTKKAEVQKFAETMCTEGMNKHNAATKKQPEIEKINNFCNSINVSKLSSSGAESLLKELASNYEKIKSLSQNLKSVVKADQYFEENMTAQIESMGVSVDDLFNEMNDIQKKLKSTKLSDAERNKLNDRLIELGEMSQKFRD